MNRMSVLCGGVLLLVAMTLTSVAVAQDGTMEIAVSPSTLNLLSNGGCVTVHADISYRSVTGCDLSVNGDPVASFSTFADSRGDLVVRCGIETIKEMVSVGEATFVLVAHTQNGAFRGTDVIRVISRGE